MRSQYVTRCMNTRVIEIPYTRTSLHYEFHINNFFLNIFYNRKININTIFLSISSLNLTWHAFDDIENILFFETLPF